MTDTLPLWLHIVAATIWVGPQFLMFVVMGPALRAIQDPETRLRVMKIVIYRFGWLAWGAMALLVLTGISNVFDETEEFAYVFDRDFRYVWVFWTKMSLVALTIALTALHTLIIGPWQVRLHEQMRGDSEEAQRLRGLSVLLSTLALLSSLAVLFAAALLANVGFSHQKA